MPIFAGTKGLVLDASVLINLLATQECSGIIGALRLRCVAPRHAFSEIIRDPVTKVAINNNAQRRLLPIEEYELDESATEEFLRLVSADPPDGLGDGEAAAIAAAASLGFGICLDDGKARRICGAAYPEMRIFWSVELIGNSRVQKSLGASRSSSAFSMARQFGRMRIPSGMKT